MFAAFEQLSEEKDEEEYARHLAADIMTDADSDNEWRLISLSEVESYLHPKVMDGTLTQEVATEIIEAIDNRMAPDVDELSIYQLTSLI